MAQPAVFPKEKASSAADLKFPDLGFLLGEELQIQKPPWKHKFTNLLIPYDCAVRIFSRRAISRHTNPCSRALGW
jgi:hypothetical protein